MSRLIPAAALALFAAAVPAAAQASPPAGPVASVSRPAADRHSIFTLAWTEIRLPRSLQDMPTGPASPIRAQRFVLSWDSPTNPPPVRLADANSGSDCTTTVLITTPCDR